MYLCISGIYQIINLKDGKVYIGSAINIRDRWSHHRSDLVRNCHGNIHLQRAWNRDGEKNFDIEILEIVKDKKLLLKHEQFWLDHISKNNQYNLAPNASSTLGVKRSKEAKEKIRRAMLGRKHTKEALRKMSEASKGRKLSTEARAKISEKAKNRIGSKNSMYGKNQTEETKRKISEANKGRLHFEKFKLYKSKITKGENNPRCILNEKQVRLIKHLLKESNMSLREIGDIFKVNLCTIHAISKNRIWKFIEI